LFDGKSFSDWVVPKGDNGHWKIVDGVIDCDVSSEAPGDKKNLWTKKEYGVQVIENARLPGIPSQGRIVLQHHGGKDKEGNWRSPPALVQFRKIAIKELD